MEGGSTSSSKTRACLNSVMGLGGINNNSNNNNVNVDNGLSSMMMMMNNSSAAGTTTGTGKPFLLPPWNASTNTSYDGQRVVPPAFMPQVHHSSEFSNSMKAKIMDHPQFPRLLAAYVNCQKVGAPPEVVARLEESWASGEAMNRSAGTGCVGEDPALDQFMEAYCEMLIKYEQELTKPIKETLLFFSKIESQLKDLTLPSNIPGQSGSSEEEIDFNDSYIDPLAEDRELKGQLLRKYSGCLGNLKQEFLKKKKKGKLPKEARHQLLEWWNRHYKWPYPSESQKQMLAESTGLDAKQINNWFINQRKRHWRPSEDMQFVMMDAAAYPQYYMENLMGNPFPVDCTQARFG